MDSAGTVRKELWRLKLNWFILFFTGILYSVSTTGFLSSYHRFVTNPKTENLNGTSHKLGIKPGLGESELFYSLLITTYNFGSVIGGLSTGILVKYIPYWQQFIFAISSHILGYTLYGVSYEGWSLMIGELLAGFYIGAQVTLCLSYAAESSVTYVELRQKLDSSYNTSAVRIRNYLVSLNSFAFTLGFFIGPGVAVVFSYLQIDQFRSIAWFNVAYGIALLILFIFLFRGESSCKKIALCRQLCQCTRLEPGTTPGPLQIFILVGMFFLSLVEMLKWGFFETLLNPILSDSFGLTLKVSSYFYLGFAVPRTVAILTLIFLQKMKVSSQVLAIIGLLMAISGYVMITDWQTIPYDPCTEYSPFHHPDIVQNQSVFENNNYTNSFPIKGSSPSESTTPLYLALDNIHFNSNIELNFVSGKTVNVQLPLEMTYTCQNVKTCKCIFGQAGNVCFSYTAEQTGTLKPIEGNAAENNITPSETYSCSQNSPLLQPFVVCVNIYGHARRPFTNSTLIEELLEASGEASGHIQSLQVLTDTAYDIASNACIHANVSNRQCHWTPFSTITKNKCDDCQPICRSRQQTLNFPQFVIGMSLLVSSNPFVWVSTVAITTNQTPKSSQGLVLGILNTMNTIAQSISPMIADAAYEGMQKRTFLAAIVLAGLHLPFLVGIVVLYRKLGPEVQQRYTKIKDNSD